MFCMTRILLTLGLGMLCSILFACNSAKPKLNDASPSTRTVTPAATSDTSCAIRNVHPGMRLEDVRSVLNGHVMDYRGTRQDQDVYFVDDGNCKAFIDFDSEKKTVSAVEPATQTEQQPATQTQQQPATQTQQQPATTMAAQKPEDYGIVGGEIPPKGTKTGFIGMLGYVEVHPPANGVVNPSAEDYAVSLTLWQQGYPLQCIIRGDQYRKLPKMRRFYDALGVDGTVASTFPAILMPCTVIEVRPTADVPILNPNGANRSGASKTGQAGTAAATCEVLNAGGSSCILESHSRATDASAGEDWRITIINSSSASAVFTATIELQDNAGAVVAAASWGDLSVDGHGRHSFTGRLEHDNKLTFARVIAKLEANQK